MLLVGLTGGIGSGKSTVAGLLAERGAVVIDADSIVRAQQVPGTEVYRRIVDQFGDGVVMPDGSLDRARIAQTVFRDDDARAALNAITHPEVMREIASRIDAYADTDAIVVLDVPLLVEVGGGEGLDVMIVVEASEELRVQRLVSARGMEPDDVRARMIVQASAEQRLALADEVIQNDGDEEALRAQVAEVWERLTSEAKA